MSRILTVARISSKPIMLPHRYIKASRSCYRNAIKNISSSLAMPFQQFNATNRWNNYNIAVNSISQVQLRHIQDSRIVKWALLALISRRWERTFQQQLLNKTLVIDGSAQNRCKHQSCYRISTWHAQMQLVASAQSVSVFAAKIS
jgi:hypothetical protein